MRAVVVGRPSGYKLVMREQRFGRLTVNVTGGPDREGGGDGPVVVLMHGFGAPGDDLVPLWRVLDVPRPTRFVFPAAPLVIPGYVGGRAWWMLDMEQLEAVMRGELDLDRSREVPEGLDEARALAGELVDEIERRLRPPPGGIVLGGFSQGAMLACDVALHKCTRERIAGLVMMSGTLLAADQWLPRMPALAGLPVLMSHGRQDPLLPIAAARALRQHLTDAGLPVDWHEFNGGHEIPPRVLDAVGAFVTRVTAAAPIG